VIYAAPAASFEAVCSNVVTGLVGTLTARIIDNAGSTNYGPLTTGITERVTLHGYGVYVAALTAPSVAGQYSVVWDDGTNPPFSEDLVVTSSALAALVPNGDDLTTVAKAASYIGDTNANTTRLQLLISAYSRAIRRYTDRQFMPVETAVAKKFRYDGAGILNLPSTELQSVTSIVLYTDLPTAQQVTLAAADTVSEADYRLEPRNKTLESTYLWLTLPRRTWFPIYSSNTPSPSDKKLAEVTITGTWGAGSTPGDVELACLIAVDNAYRSPGGFSTETMGGFTLSEVVDPSSGPGRSLPIDARALLGPYRRVALA
jgi:hypothetical protein